MEKYGQPVLLEPLNRYESNLWNRLEDTLSWVEQHELFHVQLLGDLFHMNIEEVSIAEAILALGRGWGIFTSRTRIDVPSGWAYRDGERHGCLEIHRLFGVPFGRGFSLAQCDRSRAADHRLFPPPDRIGKLHLS